MATTDNPPREIRRRSTWRGLGISLSNMISVRNNVTLQEKKKPKVQTENSYRLEPLKGTEFKPANVKRVVTNVLEQYLEGIQYNAALSAKLSTQLATVIRDRVKHMGFPRHKVVSHVIIGQDSDQALELASRCVWDAHTDSVATVTFKSKDLFAVAIVHGIYFE